MTQKSEESCKPYSDPPIREFADRGTKWLLDLPANLRGVLKIASPELVESLDFDRAIREPQTFIPDDLRKQEADILYRVPYRKGRQFVWVFVLLEHQSQPDRLMGFRLLCYMVQVWQMQMRELDEKQIPTGRRRLYPIVPIVFYTGTGRWKHPIDLLSIVKAPGSLQAFLPTWQTLLIDLHRTAPERLTQLGEAVHLVLRALQSVDEDKTALTAALHSAAASLDRLPDAERIAINTAIHYIYLMVRHNREMDEQDDLFATLDEGFERRWRASREARMTGAEALILEGEKKGREEGREEGALTKSRTLLIRLGNKRLGEPGAAAVAKIDSITDTSRLDELIERVLDVETWDDLLHDA